MKHLERQKGGKIQKRGCVQFLLPRNKLPQTWCFKAPPVYNFILLIGQKSARACPGSCPTSHEAEIKTLAGLRSYLEALGENVLPSTFSGPSSLQL